MFVGGESVILLLLFFANIKFYKEKNTLSECRCILHESTTWGHYFDSTAILGGHPSHAKV